MKSTLYKDFIVRSFNNFLFITQFLTCRPVHSPSEHTINGQTYPLESHFVFESALNVAVVGFFHTICPQSHPFLSDVLRATLPSSNTASRIPFLNLNLDEHLKQSFVYRYEGSLTTPPCSEGIEWTVVQTPLCISSEHLREFWEKMPFNARFTQSWDTSI